MKIKHNLLHSIMKCTRMISFFVVLPNTFLINNHVKIDNDVSINVTTEINHTITDPITALTVVKYTATIGASIFGAISARRQEKSIKEIKALLSETIKHLQVLRSMVEQVKKQNEQILDKLDQLPVKIRAIVKEEIVLNELRQRYNTLDDIIENYLKLSEEYREKFDIKGLGYDRLSEAHKYLFDFENRLSKIPDLIRYSEFLLIATDNEAIPIVYERVKEKRDLINALYNDLSNHINDDAITLYKFCNDKRYVKTNNIQKDLKSIEDLKYTLQPSKKETKVVQRWKGAPNNGYHTWEEIVPDKEAIQFNKDKVTIQKKIDTLVEILVNNIKRKEDLKSLLQGLDQYLRIISPHSMLVEDDSTFSNNKNNYFIEKTKN